ncbi:serine/threonine-protein phosphatase 7-like [Rhododendron vialii]|uniref:serine/threonine-protein phosphatase 7-like n=1 Tax=Rhododendron vialii TaxID=182163 RepID=UPI00265EA864|nr:serine/threonine-protein phosphatase 7-like [Rhododendron vialii]
MSHVRRRSITATKSWRQQPTGEHDVNVVEDVDEIQAVEGQVKERLAEKSQVEEESQVERIIDMEDGGQLGESGAYTLYGGGTQRAEGVTQVRNANQPISWPSDSIVAQSWVISLMDAFDWGSKHLSPLEFPSLLPVQVFDNLVLSASKILHKEPNCVTVDGLGAHSSIVVVGDIHGQLHDLLFLLQNAGFPTDNNVFVFNRDYVDRGAWGFGTICIKQKL